MKTFLCLILCLFILLSPYGGLITSGKAQNSSQDSEINPAAEGKTLGNVLETISQDTGYKFNIKDKWKDYPVVNSSNDEMPLERRLKRLLRSLNHSIIWDSDRTITIQIFGEVDLQKSRTAPLPRVSRRINPVRSKPVTAPESVAEPKAEPAEASVQEDKNTEGEEDVEKPEPGDDDSTPQEGDPEEPEEREEPEESEEQNSPEADEPSDDTTA